VVAVTNWDRVDDGPPRPVGALDAVAAATGVPFVPLDARTPESLAAVSCSTALIAPGVFTTGPVLARAGWRVEPPPSLFEHRRLGPPLGLLVLLAPAIAAVWLAVTLAAGAVEPYVERAHERPLRQPRAGLPFPLADVLAGDYGLLTMGPLLLVWALPVVLALAALLGVARASGLLDRRRPWCTRWCAPSG
jgi:ferrous iron transport protein B